jgi:Flp pilus assembly pilin Flp
MHLTEKFEAAPLQVLLKDWSRHVGKHQGQTLAEYGLVIGLVALVTIGSVITLGGTIGDTLTAIQQGMGASPTVASASGSGLPNGTGTGTSQGGGQTGNTNASNSGDAVNAGSASGEFPNPNAPDQNGDTTTQAGTTAGNSNTMENPTMPPTVSPPPSNVPSITGDPNLDAYLANNPNSAQAVRELLPTLSGQGQDAFKDDLRVMVETGGSIHEFLTALANSPKVTNNDRDRITSYLYGGSSSGNSDY